MNKPKKSKHVDIENKVLIIERERTVGKGK